MSDEQVQQDVPVSADWWWVAAIISTLIGGEIGEDTIERTVKPDGVFYQTHGGSHYYAIDIHATGPGTSQIVTTAPNDYWQPYIEQTQTIVTRARTIRRMARPTADEAIERYYRARAQGSRKTLRQVAVETGYSPGYLKKVKRAYDAAGKWGSKKTPKGVLETAT